MDIRNELHRALQPLFRLCSPRDRESRKKEQADKPAADKDKIDYKELVRNAIK